jgi:hypothetical protein
LPTLDDVVAAMRSRFTPKQAGQPVTAATITAEEWNVLASFVYLRDAAEAIVADPQLKSDPRTERLRDELLLTKDTERAGRRK